MNPTIFTADELEQIVTCAQQNPENVIVCDWTNRTIKVLGPEEEHPTAKNHKGEPLRFRPVRVRLRDRS